MHVLDASRAVGVGGACSSAGRSATSSSRQVRDEYAGDPRRSGQAGAAAELRSRWARRAPNRLAIDWRPTTPPVPVFHRRHVSSDYPLAELVERHRLDAVLPDLGAARATTPRSSTTRQSGAAARELFDDARRCSTASSRERLLTARGRRSACSRPTPAGDDIEVYADDDRPERLARHSTRCGSRWTSRRAGRNLASPTSSRPRDAACADYIGAFAVTAGHRARRAGRREFEAGHDDYSAILAKALADRLAEAFAERLHERVRREFWGYAPDETLGNEELVREQYQGIRPAPGYPACPDHTEKRTLFDLLDAPSGHRHRADRELRDVAGGVGERAGTSRTGGAATSAWAGSGATRWRTTRGGREWTSPSGALAGTQSRATSDDVPTWGPAGRRRVHVFDGAMGTMLYARGVFVNVCYDELQPQAARPGPRVHREYVRAGAEILETNTFGANPVKLFGLRARPTRPRRSTRRRRRWPARPPAAGSVVGAIGPLGIRIEPFGELTATRRVASSPARRRLWPGGVDGFILETFSDLDGVRAALEAVRVAAGSAR